MYLLKSINKPHNMDRLLSYQKKKFFQAAAYPRFYIMIFEFDC